MYYSNNPRHEPELRIDIVDNENHLKGDQSGRYFYVHVKCYKKFFLKKRKPFEKRGNLSVILRPNKYPEDA